MASQGILSWQRRAQSSVQCECEGPLGRSGLMLDSWPWLETLSYRLRNIRSDTTLCTILCAMIVGLNV